MSPARWLLNLTWFLVGCSAPGPRTEPRASDAPDGPSVRAESPRDASPPDAPGPDLQLREHLGNLGDEHAFGGAIDWLAAHPARARAALYEILDARQRNLYTYRALRALVAMHDPIDVAPIAVLLNDPDTGLQWHAATALRNHPAPEALVALATAIDATNEDVAAEAMTGVALRGYQPARPALELALSHASSQIRVMAAWALGKLGTEPSRPALEARLAIEKDKGVRKELRRALGQ